MGFLLGAFGKLSAGRQRRQLQAKLLRVRSRLTRATRQAAEMDKQLQRQEKTMLNQIKSQAMLAKQAAYNGLPVNGQLQTLLEKMNGGIELTQAEQTQYSALQNQANQGKLSIDTFYQDYLSQAEQRVADYIEYLRETQYEPLKAEEALLSAEKDSLESQIELANQDYEAMKKMEQQGAKDMVPNYTGGGQ